MTKRDFEKVAAAIAPILRSHETIGDSEAVVTVSMVCLALARAFSNGNQPFHAVTFFRACGFDPATSIAMKESLEHA